MEHPTDETPQASALDEAGRNALMRAMATAEQVVSLLTVLPYDVTLTRDRVLGAYDVHLFYSRHPEAVAQFAEAHGVTAEVIENTASIGTQFTQATAEVTGTRVRAWTLTDTPQDAEQQDEVQPDAEQLAAADTMSLSAVKPLAEAVAAEGAGQC